MDRRTLQALGLPMRYIQGKGEAHPTSVSTETADPSRIQPIPSLVNPITTDKVLVAQSCLFQVNLLQTKTLNVNITLKLSTYKWTNSILKCSYRTSICVSLQSPRMR